LLKARGVPVTLADPQALTFSRFSRSVDRFVSCPSPEDLRVFVQWLMDFGRANPGYFLYPTSDDLCWVLAKYGNRLRQYYVIHYPDLGVIQSLLDKRTLYQLARRVGLAVPANFEATSQRNEDGSGLTFPVLIKPRTQAGMRSKIKGLLVQSPAEMRDKLALFRQQIVYDADVLADVPDVNDPLIQQFYESARLDTYSMSGYCSEDGETFLVRASSKVLQNPPMIGVGLCFQGQPVDVDVQEKLRALCRSVGYFGVFEAEFIRTERQGQQQFLLMDFNPRFYGQMEFEVQRGLLLPLFPLAVCAGRDDHFQEVKELAQRPQSRAPQDERFRHRWLLQILITTQWLGRKMSTGQWRTWLTWSRQPAYDPIANHRDPWPLLWDLLGIVLRFARHPRSTFRNFFR
jgi:predicted ATP-grasp superfamily ATP-dependent carboligase